MSSHFSSLLLKLFCLCSSVIQYLFPVIFLNSEPVFVLLISFVIDLNKFYLIFLFEIRIDYSYSRLDTFAL